MICRLSFVTRLIGAIAPAVALFVALFAVGCSSRESKLVGSWQGVVTPEQRIKGAPPMSSDMKVSIVLNSDRTFTYSMGSLRNTGSWSVKAGKLYLHEKTFDGRALKVADGQSSDLIYDVAPDNTSLEFKNRQWVLKLTRSSG